MKEYDFKQIEAKWQKAWGESGIYETDDNSSKPKFYCLDMFPYPSGSGLHVGHWRGYVLSDVIARYQMLNGKNVLHPMGWDAFGLPAENAAIKNNSHPRAYTEEAIANFKKQIKQIGTTIDWSREINTSNEEYYKWTQWLFIKLYENGLAYRKKAPVNWCPSCQTVLANEQVVSGECERCGTKVIKKDLTQWFFKITDFAEDLLKDLGALDWPERTKTLQRNWIGKSEGAEITFKIKDLEENIKVFTTRADTLFGCTYVVLSPENELIEKLKERISNVKDVKKYIEEAKNKSDIDRGEQNKEKTGVKLDGIKAINPINDEEIAVFVADYVLSSYGTGAVMAVPAHDQRDFEFAKKYNIDIKQVIAPDVTYFKTKPKEGVPYVERTVAEPIIYNPKTNKYLCLKYNKLPWTTFITGGIKNGEDVIDAAKREILEEAGYKNLKLIKRLGITRPRFYAAHKNENRKAIFHGLLFELVDDEQVETEREAHEDFEVVWVDFKDLTIENIVCASLDYWLANINNKEKAFTDYGVLINSGDFDRLESDEAKKKITEKLSKSNAGKFVTNFKLHDWLISRQRYWGAPIPIIYCDKCGEVAVSEEDLPVKLPEDVEFKPHGDSPLKASESFVNVTCPKCGGYAKRETDTMDTFVCSSWYYLRYTDPGNSKEFASREKINKWMPVDTYIGGIEHAILHLLYARFFSKALAKLGIIDFGNHGEPFQKLFNIGLIYLHGAKMSKSKGNVVSPDELIEKYGTDALRGYELFIGPADIDSEWQVQGIAGIYRFLQKIWDVYQSPMNDDDKKDAQVEIAIEKVKTEIEEIRPNTAISHLMELFNHLKKKNNLSVSDAKRIVVMISPFFPHIAEEIWHNLREKDSIFVQKWPVADQKSLTSDKANIVVQVNGKTRAVININALATQEEVEKIAKADKNITKAISDKKILKTIYVSGRIINFVVE